jgi:hypothetical protein
MKTKTTTYTPSDIGCYVDNARGIYMVDRIVEIANEHGANIQHECSQSDDHTFSMCPYSGEYWDEATDYMNEHYGVDNCYWGTSEGFGDWGLWAVMDDLS